MHAAPGAASLLERAALYRFLARVFLEPPDAETVGLVREALATDDAPFDTAGLDAETFTWLFDLNAYPYASVYLDPSGMLHAPRTEFTSGFLRVVGLRVDGRAPALAPDHLAVLLDAHAVLLEREADAGTEVDAQRARHARMALLHEHLAPWLPHFAFAVRRLTSGAYARVTDVLLEAVSEDAAVAPAAAFRLPDDAAAPDAPSYGRQPAGATRRELQALLAPARSGLFLTRADIAGLARGLDLGIRTGERAFMLEALLSGAAQEERLEAALAALADVAEGRTREFVALTAERPSVAPLWTPWMERLERTRRLVLASLAS